jgi:protein-S-isoprenylcysteine O-methyltransferase Ste14
MFRAIFISLWFSVLMIAGWGSLSFFRDPAHVLLIAVLFVAQVFTDPRFRGTSRGVDAAEPGWIFLLLALLTTAGVPFLPAFFAGHQLGALPFPTGFHYAGVIVCLCGYMVRLTAERKLKKQFSYFVTVQSDHQLITTGIYSKIRHPIYLGTILFVFGLCLIFPTWYAFLFLLIYSILLIHRIFREELLLLKHFGTVYIEYSDKSFRLIPHIY